MWESKLLVCCALVFSTFHKCQMPAPWSLSDFLLFPRAKSDKSLPSPWSAWCLQEQTTLSKVSLGKPDSIYQHMYIFETMKNKISSKGISIIRLHSRYTARQRTLRASLAMYQQPARFMKSLPAYLVLSQEAPL